MAWSESSLASILAPAGARDWSGPDPHRLDLALLAVLERQTQLVLGGIAVAARQTGPDGVGGHCPDWLVGDADLCVGLTRLALVAGAVVPEQLAVAVPAELATADGQLTAAGDCYRAAIEVLDRISDPGSGLADDVRAEARALLQLAEHRLHELGRDHPACGHPVASTSRHVPDWGGLGPRIPGDYLG